MFLPRISMISSFFFFSKWYVSKFRKGAFLESKGRVVSKIFLGILLQTPSFYIATAPTFSELALLLLRVVTLNPFFGILCSLWCTACCLFIAANVRTRSLACFSTMSIFGVSLINTSTAAFELFYGFSLPLKITECLNKASWKVFKNQNFI